MQPSQRAPRAVCLALSAAALVLRPPSAAAQSPPRALVSALRARMHRIAAGGAAGLRDHARALVLSDSSGSEEVHQLCGPGAALDAALVHLRDRVRAGEDTIECALTPVPHCTTHTGVIDPPDSDFERVWVFFALAPGGRPRLRAVYFGYYNDDATAFATARTPPARCR